MSDVTEVRCCTECGVSKPIGDFRLRTGSKRSAPWRVSNCVQCERSANRTRMANEYAKDPTRIKARNKRYADSIDKEIRYQRNRCARYNLTWEEYVDMIDGQGNKCASCKDKLLEGQNTHIDHCHETNRVRAILCGDCNKALGFLKDDPMRVSALLVYIGENSYV